jgi:hypothetical protein
MAQKMEHGRHGLAAVKPLMPPRPLVAATLLNDSNDDDGDDDDNDDGNDRSWCDDEVINGALDVSSSSNCSGRPGETRSVTVDCTGRHRYEPNNTMTFAQLPTARSSRRFSSPLSAKSVNRDRTVQCTSYTTRHFRRRHYRMELFKHDVLYVTAYFFCENVTQSTLKSFWAQFDFGLLPYQVPPLVVV